MVIPHIQLTIDFSPFCYKYICLFCIISLFYNIINCSHVRCVLYYKTYIRDMWWKKNLHSICLKSNKFLPFFFGKPKMKRWKLRRKENTKKINLNAGRILKQVVICRCFSYYSSFHFHHRTYLGKLKIWFIKAIILVF